LFLVPFISCKDMFAGS